MDQHTSCKSLQWLKVNVLTGLRFEPEPPTKKFDKPSNLVIQFFNTYNIEAICFSPSINYFKR